MAIPLEPQSAGLLMGREDGSSAVSRALGELSGNHLPPLSLVSRSQEVSEGYGWWHCCPSPSGTCGFTCWTAKKCWGIWKWKDKTEEPAALQPWLCVHGWCKWKVRRSEGWGGTLGKKRDSQGHLGRRAGVCGGSGFAQCLLMGRHLCIGCGGRAMRSSAPYQRCVPKLRGVSCPSGEATHVQHCSVRVL